MRHALVPSLAIIALTFSAVAVAGDLQSGLQPGDRVYELGCGPGRIGTCNDPVE